MNWEMVAGLTRHLMTFGGGFLVTQGSITEGDLQALTGGVIAIGGVLWSAYQKWGKTAPVAPKIGE